jgi:CDP-glucose 4,6-dehydratase
LEGVGLTRENFWRGKRVFLTGHTGFKGGWLALWLQRLGAEVTGYALAPPTQPSIFELAHVARDMRSIIGDIRDAEKLSAALRETKPEIVLHLAAQPIVRQSYVDPVETYSTNVMGLISLYEAMRSVSGIRACVNVTSDKCYENREWSYAYRENDAMGGYDPYSSSKGCAELVTSAYRRSFFQDLSLPLASARAGNVIGGGDWATDRLIPDILRAISAGRPVLIRNPSAVRPWQHVLEPLSGYLELAERLSGEDGGRFAEGWNFGPSPEDTRPVQWIVEKMIHHWAAGASWQRDTISGPHEAHALSLDCLKSCRELNWRPLWSIDLAIEQIVNWHKAYLAGGDMRDVTISQINDYSNKAVCGEAL